MVIHAYTRHPTKGILSWIIESVIYLYEYTSQFLFSVSLSGILHKDKKLRNKLEKVGFWFGELKGKMKACIIEFYFIFSNVKF